jgi:uncharacterized protein (TIGR03032 family)
MTADHTTPEKKPPLEIICSRHFLSWLHNERISLAFTTYQTHRLFLVGLKPDGRLSAFERLFDRAMGLWATPRQLIMSSRYQIWQFYNPLAEGEEYNGYDRIYVPRVTYTTGELDAHDVVEDGEGQILFVNTLYSCLAKVSQQYSFTPIWQPPFISKLAPEDRCHLNGLALKDGKPAYVTAVSRSDAVEGWRDRRGDGGCLMDVNTSEIIMNDLSMPHSPRYYRGQLWLLNSGTGEFGRVDMDSGRFEPVAFCPGYLRGLAFHDHYAIVGLSKPRHNRIFTGLALDERLADKESDPRCGLMVIDLDTGNIVHWMQLEGVVTELYDVQVMNGVRLPMSLGLRTDEIRRFVSMDPRGRPESERATNITLVAAADPPASTDTTDFEFRSTDRVKPADAIQYDALTFPSVKSRWQVAPPRGALHIITVGKKEDLAGSVMAEISPDGTAAEIISLFVASQHRRKGLGRSLMEGIELNLTKQGCRRISTSFRSDWSGTPVLEKIIKGNGWPHPRMVRKLFKTNIEKISKAPWMECGDLPEGLTLFPWHALTGEERQDIVKRQAETPWYPEMLSPFQEEKRLEPMNSLGLRQKDRVAGWMITHRTLPDTIQYTALFLTPELQQQGVAIHLAVAAIRRQQDAGIPWLIWMLDSSNQPVLKFAEQYLNPYTQSVDLFLSEKIIK